MTENETLASSVPPKATMDEALDYLATQSKGNYTTPVRIGDLSFKVGETIDQDRLEISILGEDRPRTEQAYLGPIALRQICSDVRVPYSFFCMNQADLRESMMKRWIQNNAKKKRLLNMASRFSVSNSEAEEGQEKFSIVEEPCIRSVVSPNHNQVTNLQFLQEINKTNKEGIEWVFTGGNNVHNKVFNIAVTKPLDFSLEKNSPLFMAVYFSFSEMGYPFIADHGLWRGTCANQIRLRPSRISDPDRRVSYSKLNTESEFGLIKSMSLQIKNMFDEQKETITKIGAEPLTPEKAISLVDEYVDYKMMSRKVAKELANSVLGEAEEDGQKFTIRNKYDLACCLSAKARDLTYSNRHLLEGLAGKLLLVSNN